jgi:tetratricopeptide (TPR) repeat protein
MSHTPARASKRTPASRKPAGTRSAASLSFPRWVLVLTVAGALVRVFHVLAERANPFSRTLLADSRIYDSWGQRIAGGEWIGRGVFYQDPLYPYFLGIFYALFGHHLLALQILQALLGSLNVLLLWRIAARLWDRSVAAVASVLACLYAPFLFYDGLVLKTFLEVLFLNASLAAFLVALDSLGGEGLDPIPSPASAGSKGVAPASGTLPGGRRALPAAAASGILLGLGILTRANYLLLALVLVVWLFLWGAKGHRRARAAAAVFVGTILLVLLPVLVRNRVAGGEWVLTTSQAGQNLYTGNNPGNRSGLYVAPPFVRPDPQHEQEDFHRQAERLAGHPLSASAASRFWFRQALEEMGRRPLHSAGMTLRKLGLLLHRYEVPDNEDIRFWGRYSPWLRFNPIRFGLILPLAAAGAVLGWRERRRLALLYLLPGVYLLSVAFFFVLGRYRLPAVSFLLVFAAAALTEGYARIRERRWRALAPALAGLAVGIIVAHRPIPEEVGPMSASMYTNLGQAELDAGHIPEALAAQRKAVELAPGWDEAAFNLGVALYRSGDRAAAIDEFRHVLELNPDFAGAQSYLGNLLEEEGRIAEAIAAQRKAATLQPQEAMHLFNLARLLVENGDWDEAGATLQRLFALKDPRFDVDGLLLQSQVEAHQEDYAAACDAVRRYLDKRPDSPMRRQLESALRAWEAKRPGP